MTSAIQVMADAAADFAAAASKDHLWGLLHRHLDRFGIGRILYGAEATPHAGGKHDFMLSSYDPGFLAAKIDQGLFYSDEYVRASRVETQPILWSETERLEDLAGDARRSLDIDWDYRVLTGVTLPLPFADGLGRAGIGLHAPDMAWVEFDRLWAENQRAIRAVVDAFDVTLRLAHAREMLPLSRRERECLLWLIAGQRHQQIAYRLGIHEKTVEKQIQSARRKLKAATVAQAVAIALAYRLLMP